MRPALRIVQTAAPLLLALSAAACASTADQASLTPEALTPTEQFPIEIRQQPEEMRLAAHPEGLSYAQEQALGDLAARWRAQGGGAITIQAPTIGGRAVAVASAEGSRNLLVSLGVSPEEVRIAGYDGPPDQPPVLRVTFMTYQASGPTCGESWENLAADGANRPWANFGCAVTANIAAQVANPRDFLTPRGQGPADATRRSTVLDKYRKGEVSGQKTDEKSNGAVSEAVKD